MECEECVGPGVNNCTACKNEYIVYPPGKSGVCTNCKIISELDPRYTSTYLPDKLFCQELCGDGFNMGQAECDDGNIEDKDGCD